jgi:phage-related protein
MPANIGTAYVTIMPTTKGFVKQLGGVGKVAGATSGKSFAGSFASAIGGIGKVGGVAFAAIATAIGAVGKSSLDAYKDFEQLSGGVQKIFDEVDYSKIERDAQDAYRNMGMSANEYMGVMTTVGANFAATLGDQKGYDVAKKGMQAISDYSTGTGRSMDELSEKYQLITRSTASYQSIADQFAGILPATSSDFLAQAQAAGLLSEKYTKLTQVPMAEYQEAVTGMLEKGVEQLGLAGNTAAEAASTISGSLDALSGAWQNWLTGIADPNADMGKLTEGLADSIANVAANIGERATIIGQGIAENLPTIVGAISSTLPSVLAPIVDTSVSLIGSGISDGLASVGIQLPPDIIDVSAFEGLGAKITEKLQAIPDWISSHSDMFGGLIESAGRFASGLASALGGAIDFVAPIIEGLANATLPLLSSALDFVGGFLEGFASLLENLARAFQPVTDAVGPIAEAIGGALCDALSTLGEMMAQADFSDFADFMNTTLTDAINGAIGLFDSLSSAVTDKMGAASDFLSTTWGNAKNSISSIWDGIKSGVTEKAEGLRTGIASKLDEARAKAESAFDSVKSRLSKPFEDARATISGIMSRIKGMFPLSIGRIFSNLSLPHITVNGGKAPFGIGGKGSLPSFGVNWYAKGAIFDHPAIVGVGEAGQEAVVPIDKLRRYIVEANQESKRPPVNVYVTGVAGPDEVADAIARRLQLVL